MAITVRRPDLTWKERIYLPAILTGMAITFRHLKNMLLGRTKVTMQYPEEKWDSHMPDIIAARRRSVVTCRPHPLRRVSALRIHLPAARDQDHPGRAPGDDKFAKVESILTSSTST
jgi:NADH-quinone oxidoreductase subunit I